MLRHISPACSSSPSALGTPGETCCMQGGPLTSSSPWLNGWPLLDTAGGLATRYPACHLGSSKATAPAVSK